MKVLQLVDTLSAGGAERLLETMARFGPANRLDVEIAALNADDDARQAMVPLLHNAGITPLTLGFRRLADPGAGRRLVQHIRRTRCDVVHAHLEYAAIVGALAAGICRRPLVVTLHHVSAPTDRKSAAIERVAVALAGRRASSLVFVSEASRASFAERYRERPNWTVIPNGIELPDYPPASGSFSVAPPDGPIPEGPRAVLVGNMRPGKGHAEAIDAWPHICRRVPDAVLVLVGSGELEADLRRRAVDRGVADRIVFAGFHRDVQAAMAAADVVLLPSHSEALPTVLMEAAALGKAAVATRVGGVPEVIDDGVTGLLVVPGDHDAFVDATVALLIDPARRERLGAAARCRAEMCFDARLWVERLSDLYAGASAARTRTPTP